MAFLTDAALDSALQYIANNADRLILTSAEATTYTQANTTFALADVAIDSADFTISNGDISGRKTTLGTQTSFPVDTSGTATHWAIVDDTDTELVATGSLTASQVLTSGNTVTTSAFDVCEIADVVSE